MTKKITIETPRRKITGELAPDGKGIVLSEPVRFSFMRPEQKPIKRLRALTDEEIAEAELWAFGDMR